MLSCPVQACVQGEQSIPSFLVSAIVSVVFSVGHTASVYAVLKLEGEIVTVCYSGSPAASVEYKYMMVVIVGQ